MNVKLTLIIPTYNRSNIIQETLDSVSNQTYTDFECLIVDDCSQDATLDVISSIQNQDSRFRLIRNESNKGACYSRNRALAFAQGKFTCFLDSDDLLHPQYLEKQYRLLTNTLDAGLAICKSLFFRNSVGDCENLTSTNLESPITLERYLRGEISWVTSCSLWRTHVIRDLGGFSEKLGMFQDWELNARYLAMENKVILNPECLVYYRYQWDANQISSISGDKKKHTINFYCSRRMVLSTHLKIGKQLSLETRNTLANNFANLPSELIAVDAFKEALDTLLCSLYLERHPRPLKFFMIKIFSYLANKIMPAPNRHNSH